MRHSVFQIRLDLDHVFQNLHDEFAQYELEDPYMWSNRVISTSRSAVRSCLHFTCDDDVQPQYTLQGKVQMA